uniref:Uncharacterized protein n=1 Tax=Arundo donax TaxID=35708 RepID=A0A0A8YXC9_ARUDO
MVVWISYFELLKCTSRLVVLR